MEEQKIRQKIKNPLEDLIEKKVQVITSAGKVLVGILRGLDQSLNCILEGCIERVYSEDQGIQEVKLGLYVIRGEHVASLGEVDLQIEEKISFSDIKAAPINPVNAKN
ncbi:Like-Sm (LSM) domain [Pseudocohnilembus persalinus]|uniref:U6 snRNA-associated Sm-like protein LSm8 n=1 Tax=Pseudocohnilembus persalinus TaxID=266149 RepID=A0A0V0Q980_PSEPJ|nr:Like-Sm (LSM) domain [Pseudocohnilembus persalinus]|eukprot:KRW98787.1 Like-Sm (LSM) domain [Pseudocohnilembus persalinus]